MHVQLHPSILIPKIKIKFDSFVLPVVGVSTDDIDLIEDMFSRLNEAVPLNAAEKRNALGGPMVSAIRDVSEHLLFAQKVSFTNKRYQHREVSARFLLLELNLKNSNRIIDTKKVYLDAMVKNHRTGRDNEVTDIKNTVINNLDNLSSIFSDISSKVMEDGFDTGSVCSANSGSLERVLSRFFVLFSA